MNYSPKLKSAMEQIKDILKENDIAGFVVLHDKTSHSEYLNHISPSWSCAKFDFNNNIKLVAKASEIGKEKAHQMKGDTYNMFTHFADIVGMNAMNFIKTKEHLKTILGGEDGDSSHSSHSQQNN